MVCSVVEGGGCVTVGVGGRRVGVVARGVGRVGVVAVVLVLPGRAVRVAAVRVGVLVAVGVVLTVERLVVVVGVP